MNTIHSTTTKLLAGALSAGFLFTTLTPVEAGWRGRSGTATGPRGNQTKFQQQRQRERGQAARTTTWQNRRGEGFRDTGRQWNRDAGTAGKERRTRLANGKESSTSKRWQRNDDGSVSSQARRTGFDGKTSSREGTTVKTDNGRASNGTWTGKNGNAGTYQSDVVKTENGYRRATVVTDQNGQSATYNKDVMKNQDGSWTTNKSALGPNGKSAESSKTTVRTANGRSTTGNYATGDGKSGTFNRDIANAPGERRKTTSVTNQDGQTASRDVLKQWDQTGGAKTVTRTNPDGESKERTYTIDLDAPEIEQD